MALIRSRSALSNHQGLADDADLTEAVENRGMGTSHAVCANDGGRSEGDPFSSRRPTHVYREVGIHKREPIERKAGGNSTGSVCREHHPLERSRGRVIQQGLSHAEPGGDWVLVTPGSVDGAELYGVVITRTIRKKRQLEGGAALR